MKQYCPVCEDMQDFRTLVESLSDDELQAETKRAIHESRDSFLLDGEDTFSKNP